MSKWRSSVCKLVRKFLIILIELSNLGLHPFFFVDAVGGTGKTFLFNALLAKWRSERKVIPAVASTGIAALLLSQARTAHSSFKVHFDAMGLKVGSPVILLHNMDPVKGVCMNYLPEGARFCFFFFW